MPVYHGIEQHVGNTPLIRLRRLSEITGCEILGKAEFMNPGGSVKDRAALGIIMDAEQEGLLKAGDTIVEGTAGNTGIGLTIIGHARGCHSVIVIPETQTIGLHSGLQKRMAGFGQTSLTTSPTGGRIISAPVQKSGDKPRER